jgi:hypothetical protein
VKKRTKLLKNTIFFSMPIHTLFGEFLLFNIFSNPSLVFFHISFYDNNLQEISYKTSLRSNVSDKLSCCNYNSIQSIFLVITRYFELKVSSWMSIRSFHPFLLVIHQSHFLVTYIHHKLIEVHRVFRQVSISFFDISQNLNYK